MVQGIGFIAAGVILTTGKEVIGLTITAGLWVATALGLLIGAGFYFVAIVATVATVVALVALGLTNSVFLALGRRPGLGMRLPVEPYDSRRSQSSSSAQTIRVDFGNS